MSNEAEVSEKEIIQYDRQIRLWGLDAQKRLRAAKVCVFGLDSLGSEIVKNLVLAGIDQMTLVDNRKPDEKTLLMTEGLNFDTRAEACLSRVRDLNPNVKVDFAPGSIEDKDREFFSKFTLVIICGIFDRKELERVTALLRDLKIKHIIGATMGMYGFGFNDFLEHEYIEEVEEKGEKKNVKGKIDFKSFSDSFSAAEPALGKRKKHMLNTLHIFKAALTGPFKETAANFPGLKDNLEQLIADTEGDIPPIGAICGGILGQEAIKAIGLKEKPLENVFIWNGVRMSGDILSL